MYFTIIKGLPYYLDLNKKTISPCEISAKEIKVDFKNVRKIEKVDRVYNESEIRLPLDIKLLERVDEKGNKIYVSNKTISSYPKTSTKVFEETNSQENQKVSD